MVGLGRMQSATIAHDPASKGELHPDAVPPYSSYRAVKGASLESGRVKYVEMESPVPYRESAESQAGWRYRLLIIEDATGVRIMRDASFVQSFRLQGKTYAIISPGQNWNFASRDLYVVSEGALKFIRHGGYSFD